MIFLWARINSYELAFKLQTSAPELADISNETVATKNSTASATTSPATSAPSACSPGIDHEPLAYPYQGRDFRLTDVLGSLGLWKRLTA
jgi:hypothetical protein